MTNKLPYVLNNLLPGEKILSKKEKVELYKNAFPTMTTVASIKKKFFKEAGENLGTVEFPDLGLMFGSHSASYYEKGQDIPSLIIPLKGSVKVKEINNGINLKHCANLKTGSYLSGDVSVAESTPCTALAVGFNPKKLLEVSREILQDNNFELPQTGFTINFEKPKLEFLLKKFLLSLNGIGSFAINSNYSQDLIFRNCASIILSALGHKIPSRFFKNNTNVIDYVCAYMIANLSQNINLSDLVDFSGFSARTLQVEFKKRFQVSPLTWLFNQRMARAFQILSGGNSEKIKISDVCRDCGFNHLGRFSVDFRKKFGFSPAELRKAA